MIRYECSTCQILGCLALCGCPITCTLSVSIAIILVPFHAKAFYFELILLIFSLLSVIFIYPGESTVE